jgi:hypothetical protein
MIRIGIYFCILALCIFSRSALCAFKPLIKASRFEGGVFHEDKYTSLLKIRGGLRELNFPSVTELANRRNDAQNLLNNIKVPASLFAGAALGGMYISEAKTAHKRLRMLFLIASNMALVCMILTVFTSTICYWRLMGNGYDPMAYTAAELLLKYFDYEYLSISVSFFFGLCFFLSAVILRVAITFGNSYETGVLSALNLMVMFYMIRFYDHAIISNDDGLWGVIKHLTERSLVVLPKIFINLEFVVFLVTFGSLGAYINRVLKEDELNLKTHSQGGNSVQSGPVPKNTSPPAADVSVTGSMGYMRTEVDTLPGPHQRNEAND